MQTKRMLTRSWKWLVKKSREKHVTQWAIVFKVLSLVSLIMLIKLSSPMIPVQSEGSFVEVIVKYKLWLYGYAVAFLTVLFTLIKDVESLRISMPHIPFGTSVSGTKYDFIKFFNSVSAHALIIGLNLRPLLNRREVRDRMLQILQDNKFLTIIVAPPIMNAAIGRVQFEDLKRTVELLKEFKAECDRQCTEMQRSNLKVIFHKDAASMSALIRDPDLNHEAAIVPTIKWTTDTHSNNRLFFVASKYEHPECFSRLLDSLREWDGSSGVNLDEISEKIESIERNLQLFE